MSLENIAGQGIWVARQGEGAAHTLMLHCSLARHEALLRVASRIDGRVTLFDLPDHGRSDDLPDGLDLHDQVTQIATTLIEDGSHVVGHSFGATVALRLALQDPRVSRLTLIEPVLFSVAEGTEAYRQHGIDYEPVKQAFDAGDMEAAARAFLQTWGMGVPWEALPDKVRRESLRAIRHVRDSEDCLHRDRIGFLDPGRLETLDIPVTLIAGAKTHPVVADIHAGLAARLPRATCVVIPGAGHMVPITHPKEVGRAMGLGV